MGYYWFSKCTPLLRVAVETMHILIAQTNLFFKTTVTLFFAFVNEQFGTHENWHVVKLDAGEHGREVIILSAFFFFFFFFFLKLVVFYHNHSKSSCKVSQPDT